MSEQPTGGHTSEKGTRPGGRIDRIPTEHRGAHPSTQTKTPGAVNNTQIEQDFLSSFGIFPAEIIPHTQPQEITNSSRPIFGQIKNAKSETDDKKWKTLGIGTWLYNSPSWNPDRIRLGRADISTVVEILQEVRGQNGRLAQEVIHRYKGKDGKDYESRFWVHPKKGGYDGMPKQPIKQISLKTSAKS